MKKFGCAKLQNLGKQTFVAQHSIALSGSKALSLGLLLFFSIVKVKESLSIKPKSDNQLFIDICVVTCCEQKIVLKIKSKTILG